MMDFSNEQEFDRRRKYEFEQQHIFEKKQRGGGDTDSEKLADEDDLESEGEVLDEDEDDFDEHSDGSFKEPQFGGLAARRKNS